VPTGGDLLVRALVDAGVEVAFGLPGVHNLPLWKALSTAPIRVVGTRHEQAAAHAADGYARATGRLGVTLVTTGPGAANTLGAVGEAWASGTPLLIIATDIATALRRPGTYRGVLHETTDQAGMFAPVTKATVRVAKAEELYAAVQMSVFTAMDAPTRPVYLEVPTDLLAGDVGGGYLRADIDDDRLRLPEPEATGAAIALLRRARRPLIWAGGGALRAGAGPAVAELAARLAAPVLTTFGARGLLGASHPCAVGLPPHVPQVGALWDDADVVVAIGTDFDGTMTQNWLQPAPPDLVTVNLDAADAAKAYSPTVSLVADARLGTETLVDLLDPAGDRLDDVRRRLEGLRQEVRGDIAAREPAALDFLDAMDEVLPDGATVVADMCIPGYWYAGFGAVAGPRRLAHPMGWGTLGFAFPAALGASLGSPGPVVSISGDGGFLFATGELATAAQESLPLTAVVVDDGGYGMLRFDQVSVGDTPFGVDLRSPDFVALAAAFGVPGESVEGFGKAFRTALGAHVARPEPSVLVVHGRLEPPLTTSPRWYRSTGT